MHLYLRRLLVMLCTLGLLLGSLSAALGGANPAIAATPSGGAYAWGYNGYGQLGDGTTTDKYTPVAITLVPAVTVATAVAAGYAHSLAIGSDGNVYAWGYNANDEQGDGTNYDNINPVLVELTPGLFPLALGTGSGAQHSLAILTSSSGPTAAILSRFHAVHAGGATLFHWRVASGAGVRGFFLTAGTHRLNRRLIAVNAHRQSYAYRSRWQGHGPYLLHGVLQGGAVVTLASTG